MRQDKYPDNHAGSRRRKSEMMEGVYAGPDYFAQQRPDPQMMQTVYAGPDYYAQPVRPPIGAPAPDPAQPVSAAQPQGANTATKWCHACGMPLLENAKFCIECGAVVPRDDA